MDSLITASELLEVIKEYTKAYADNKCEVFPKVVLTADYEVMVLYEEDGNRYIKVGLDDFNTVFDMVDFMIESMRKGVR